ncbi:fused MFS/spermidine synthase [Humitalea sp. 24SJ18S-53]|uniref:fused MFS/spermidine synthase n=1 Tax=Humitalea sp. 24SJ18S-53 TaxID=3422307 RepID=UPI003D67F85B
MGRLSLAFFASGFAALLCQIVWQRMLGIFAGSDTVSAALVVGAFLAGLGIGSLVGARWADRLAPHRALIGFAIAEAGVAGFALVSKVFLYDTLAIGLAGTVDAPMAIFALCFLGLLLPTVLMGASLPLLSRAIAVSLDTLAARIGALYGWNTLGAGVGALAGGWLLVGNLGFEGALWLAAALNLFAAALALTLLPGLRRAVPPATVSAEASAGYGGLPMWCLLVFLSGYVIVALEIVWVRILGQVGQFHAYLFPTVLGIFLLADGAGMAVAARMVRRLSDPRPAFFITQSAGFVLATALLALVWLAAPHWPLSEWLTVDQNRLRGGNLVATVLLTLLVVGPPSFLIGMTFPLVQRAVQRDLASVGSRVGWVQLANIAGNAAGSIGTGLVSLHVLGTAGTLVLLAALSFLLVLGWLWTSRRHLRARWPEMALAAACAVAVMAWPSNDGWWRRMHLERPGQTVAWAEDRSGIAFFRDDAPGDVARGAAAAGLPHGPFFIQGFAQGRTPFLPLHQFLGAVGPLVHPDARTALAIGVGSGGTPWAASILPRTQLRAIELVGPVLDTLEETARKNPGGPLARLFADPRISIEYGDGRRALARATEKFDLIQADAVLPEASHSGLLYSQEFLELVRSRLAPGGLYVQWAPSARVTETFAAVFPHAILLLPASVLIGSDSPIPFDAARLADRFQEAAVMAHLRAGNPDFGDYAAMFADPPVVWGPATPRAEASLTDMFPRDEFYLNNGVRAAIAFTRPPH